MKNISVIVPVFNEVANIKLLVNRLHETFQKNKINYEIIFIDDHSTDKTCEEIIMLRLTRLYPVYLHLKKGKPGKAQSIIEGIRYARFDTIAMIDGDLQYPPEAIPYMYNMIDNNKDTIIVADRVNRENGKLRKLFSKTYAYFFAKLLHNLTCDVQSGLKVFPKEIIERLHLEPSSWAFDTEFLVKARAAGYNLGSYPIVFAKRYTGHSKVNLLKTSWEIGWAAVKLKMAGLPIIPLAKKTEKKEGIGFHFNGKKFISHTRIPHNETALQRLTKLEFGFVAIFILIVMNGLVLNWHNTIIVLVAVLTAIYFIDLLYYLFLIYRSFTHLPEISVSQEEMDKIKPNKWPFYTIFCPLYKEWQVLPQFIEAISKLDYPHDKLSVILLLEENDKKTIEKAQSFTLPEYYRIVVVPDSAPKTKPKALNYGMKFMKGQYVVIYDAEDIPEPQQLKKAVIAFEKSDRRTVCVQAKLNFFNPHQNVLTRLFTTEYSLWFDLILPGLQSLNAPIPLGGTSNHFRRKDLIKLKGWDAFNVTEDADLGVRLFKKGYQTQILDSTTYEEANSEPLNWFRQRSRWIKGYIQTYLVHMRDLRSFRNYSLSNFISFQLVVGGKVFLMFINPLMWVITIVYFALRPYVGDFIESFFPGPVMYMGVISLVFGNFLYFYYYMIGCAKRGQYELIKYAYLVPIYWLSMSIAAWIAVISIIKEPHYWAKTIHGLHLDKNKIPETQESETGLIRQGPIGFTPVYSKT